VRVAVALEQPPVPVTVYVMFAVPAPTPVITPVEALTVATPVASEVHAPPALPLLENVVVPATQIPCVPLKVPAFGVAVTVTERVAVALEQPPVPVTVYVMFAVPALTPVITPVEALTVATPVASEVHAPPALPLLENVVVPPTQIPCVPLKVPALGAAVTVTVRVAVALEQPPVPVTVYVMFAVPAATPVITPEEAFTVAMPTASEVHVPPVFPFDVKVVVPLTQIACVPLTVPAFGVAVTVTERVAVALEQPPVPVTV
jgi:hypothetical protein